MPKTIIHAQHRKVVLKMTIEIIVTFCKAYFDGEKPADRVNDMLICAAILVGQVEGHPLNASKVSEWVAMARPTVIRRLAVLEKKGFVVRAGRTFKLRHEVVNSERVVASGMVAREAIFTACAQLSKLDSKPVARP
jgi:hypothetical protein